MKKVVAIYKILWYTMFRSRECWNWQTGKTKDLVGVCSCGFKSHLPHWIFKNPVDILVNYGIIHMFMQKWRNWQTRTVQVRVVAIP